MLGIFTRLLVAISLGGLGACSDSSSGSKTASDSGMTDDGGAAGDGDGDTTGDGDGDGTTSTGSLVACDGTDDGGCGADLCAGSPPSGFFCRPPCPDDAAPGDSCPGGTCLENEGRAGGLACTAVEDCDFMTGNGCDAGDACVILDLKPLLTACVPEGDGVPDSRCDPNGNECESGLACLGSDIEDGDPGRCTTLCVPGEELPNGCPLCVAVTDELGACAECSILENDCDDGSRCQPANELLGGVCIPFGPSQAGEECGYDAETACEEGLLCIEDDNPNGPDPLFCAEICDTEAPSCSAAGSFCNDIGIFEAAFETGKLALCFEAPGQFCSQPRGLSCPDNLTCLQIDQDIGLCLSDCDPTTGDAACEDNYACIPYDGDGFYLEPFFRGNGVCAEGCSDNSDCGGDACLMLGGIDDDGVCGVNASDSPCDPSGQDTCDDGLTCMALEGESDSGVCLPVCFVQGGEGCNNAGDNACIGKSGDEWHTGVCLGTVTPCDPIEQSGCDPAETCGVMGGAAFGGHSFRCEEQTGPAAEGGDCDNDDECSAGLACVGKICRRFCDPQDNQCATGSCGDVSAQWRLEDNSLGVCL